MSKREYITKQERLIYYFYLQKGGKRTAEKK